MQGCLLHQMPSAFSRGAGAAVCLSGPRVHQRLENSQQEKPHSYSSGYHSVADILELVCRGCRDTLCSPATVQGHSRNS